MSNDIPHSKKVTLILCIVECILLAISMSSCADRHGWISYKNETAFANVINDIAVSPDGSVWFATSHGVHRYDGKRWSRFFKEDGLAGDVTQSIAIAPNGDVWVGDRSQGISHYDGSNWTVYGKDQGFLYTEIFSVAVAPDGSVWAGTSGGGHAL